MEYKRQLIHTLYILHAKVIRAGPFPPYYTYPSAICGVSIVVVIMVVVVVCGKPAVYNVVYCGGCLHLRCICSSSAVRLCIVVVGIVVCVCGTSTVCLRCICSAPAVPLRCARGTPAARL